MQITKYLIHGQETPMGLDDLIDYLAQYGTVHPPDTNGWKQSTQLFPPGITLSTYQRGLPQIRVYHDGFVRPGDIYANGLPKATYASLTDAINDFLDVLELKRSKQP